MKPFKFYVVTDTHYFKNSLGASGRNYDRFMRFEQKCFAETQSINESLFAELEKSDEADTVIFPGDLTFNGEKESHLEFVKLLAKLKESGKKVYVITASHDYGEHPRAYRENGEEYSPDELSFDEAYDMYKDFGYDDAIAFNRKHLSYVAQLSDDVRLLALCNDTAERKNSAYDDEFMSWIIAQAKKAKEDGCMMIAMEHYPVLPGQPILSIDGDARQKESDYLLRKLAENDVHLIFTGHMHNQSINEKTTYYGDKFYDVCTGSAIGWPAYYRLVTLESPEKAAVKSIPVPDFKWDKKGKPYQLYLSDLFDNMIKNIIFEMRDDPADLCDHFGLKISETYYPVLRCLGKTLSAITVGGLCRLFAVRPKGSFSQEKVLDVICRIGRGVFEGNQKFVKGTDEGDTVIALLDRLKPLLSVLSGKIKGAQGEKLDLYDVLVNSVGNYGIDDYNAVLFLK